MAMDFSFEEELILENDRALLRPLLSTDFDHLLAIATEDPTLIQYSPALIHTPEYLRQYIVEALTDRGNGQRYPFVIYDKKFNEYAGTTSYFYVSNKDRRVEIGGTWIGRKFQRTGLNQQCKFLLLQYVFDELQFERVALQTDERNTASRAAIEKLGATQEGIFRSHVLLNNGFRRNTVYYSILKSEWSSGPPK